MIVISHFCKIKIFTFKINLFRKTESDYKNKCFSGMTNTKRVTCQRETVIKQSAQQTLSPY